ncbi:hypothetical protein P8452_01829 [Trifolium repens]|nr:hypothetical protein P8452_01829 [Trifolium repens]
MKERPSRLAGRKKHKNRSMKERNSEKEIGELQCRRRDLTTEIRRRRTSKQQLGVKLKLRRKLSRSSPSAATNNQKLSSSSAIKNID